MVYIFNMRSAAMSIVLHVFDEDLCAFLPGGYLGVEMIGHRICICSVFIDTAKCFPKGLYKFILPVSVYRNFQYPLKKLC